MKYLIKETQTFNSDREGVEIEAASLRAAKIFATKNQSFYGTVLKIYNDNGDLLAHRAPDIGGATEQWQNN